MSPERTEQSMHEKLERIETELKSLSEITHQQAQMIDTQAGMAHEQTETINKMWQEIQPILADREKMDRMKTEIYGRMLSAGMWGFITGAALLVWQGFKFYIKGDN